MDFDCSVLRGCRWSGVGVVIWGEKMEKRNGNKKAERMVWPGTVETENNFSSLCLTILRTLGILFLYPVRVW